MTPRLSLRLCLVTLLAACAGAPAPRSEIVRHDFSGPATAVVSLPLRSIDVSGSSWLATPAMHYRLGSSTERQQFAHNRWLAPPTEMVALRLRRSLPPQPPRVACNLRLEVDDLIQVFSDSRHSELRLEARAALFSPQGMLARHNFRLALPAGSDAAGAAAVSGELLSQLTRELHSWSQPLCH